MAYEAGSIATASIATASIINFFNLPTLSY
jgi:hypothetical protein